MIRGTTTVGGSSELPRYRVGADYERAEPESLDPVSAYDLRMDAQRREHEWDTAVDLATAVAAGSDLPTLASPALLDAGERLHADVPADGWRYHAVDVTYVAPRSTTLGGSLMCGLVAAGSAAGRRRARRDADALAAPQWRSLGALRVLATDRRLLVWYEGAWASVWYGAIRELRPALEIGRLDLSFDDDPPYCLAGPWVPYLTVVVTTLLAQHRGITAMDGVPRVHVSD